MMDINILDCVLADDNIYFAIQHLQTKKNACGDDGIWLHDLDIFWKLNGEKIKGQIYSQCYHPQIIRMCPIITKNGKHRMISKLSSVDRLLLRAIHQVICPVMERKFSKSSFAYRNGSGVCQAVEQAADIIESGKEYVVRIDVRDFFDSISHKRILALLKDEIADLDLMVLLEKYIVCTVESDFKLSQKSRGLVQGNPLSPLLSNLYLDDFDKYLEKKGLAFVRFADDINIYVRDVSEGCDIYEQIAGKLKEYSLEVNGDKSGIFSVYARPFLGYDFEKRHGQVIVKKHSWQPVHTFAHWHENIVEKSDNQYYIVNNGILTRHDFSILFENQSQKTELPCEFTDSINVFSNVEFSANLFEQLGRHGININIFDRYANLVGTFYSYKQRSRMDILIKQVEAYQKPRKRLYYAQRMEIASLHNIRCNLKYYYKHKPSVQLSEKIIEIGNAICEVRKCKDLNKLLMIEARCRQSYYQCFNEILKNNDFEYKKRSRRPPLDAINALISFGNSILYQRIAQAIHYTSIDIRISFVHSSMKRHENLNLDIADIFKPVIVDRTIFTLINKKMLCAKSHFNHNEDGSVLLNAEGKNIFLRGFESKLRQRVTLEGKSYSYEQLIYQEIRNLEKSLLQEQKYRPYQYQI